MPKKKSIIPANVMYDIIRKVDREIRVSDSATKVLSLLLEDVGFKIAKEAVVLCKHANRKTVRKEDVELAKSKI